MSGVTDNYGFILPVPGEAYDVDLTNSNSVEIDKQLKNRENQAKGLVAYAELSPSTGGINTEAVVLNIASFNFKANRNYRIGASGSGSVDALGSTFAFRIATCVPADAFALTTGLTQIKASSYKFDTINEGRPVLDGLTRDRFKVGADTTLQIKLTAQRAVGTTGSVILTSPDDTNRVCLFIEDLGVQI